MRVVRLIIVIALAVVLAGSAGLVASTRHAGTSLQPPVIREVFTVLPCPMHPQTTLAMEGCDEHAILDSDRTINAQVKALFSLLRTHAARLAFVRGEVAWAGYRRSSCTAEASAYDGGSFQPVAFAGCLVARNRTHLADLAAARRVLKQH